MREEYGRAKKIYDAKVNKAYYTSSKFAADTAKAAGTVGAQMGARQALGFVFAEIWFAIKRQIKNIGNSAASGYDKFVLYLKKIVAGVKDGIKNVKAKFSSLLKKFFEGAVSGILSSVTTTICNIFLTTAKNVVKVIRQVYPSLVEAVKILFFNPDIMVDSFLI